MVANCGSENPGGQGGAESGGLSLISAQTRRLKGKTKGDTDLH